MLNRSDGYIQTKLALTEKKTRSRLRQLERKIIIVEGLLISEKALQRIVRKLFRRNRNKIPLILDYSDLQIEDIQEILKPIESIYDVAGGIHGTDDLIIIGTYHRLSTSLHNDILDQVEFDLIVFPQVSNLQVQYK